MQLVTPIIDHRWPPAIVRTAATPNGRLGKFLAYNAGKFLGGLYVYHHGEPILSDKNPQHHVKIGSVGNCHSIRQCLYFAQAQGFENVFIIEDDCLIVGEIPIDSILTTLGRDDCHLINCCPTPTEMHHYGPCGTVFLAVNKRGYEPLIKLLSPPITRPADTAISHAINNRELGVSVHWQNARYLDCAQRWALHDESAPSTIQTP